MLNQEELERFVVAANDISSKVTGLYSIFRGNGEPIVNFHFNEGSGGKHAEEVFLEYCNDVDLKCYADITLYISRSPCSSCSTLLRNFARENKNKVTVKFRKLYMTKKFGIGIENRQGIRDLSHHVVILGILTNADWGNNVEDNGDVFDYDSDTPVEFDTIIAEP